MTASLPRHPDQPDHRRHDIAQDALQRDRRAADLGQHAEDRVAEVHQRHQHQQHGDDVDQQLHARRGALDDRVHGAARHRLERAHLARGAAILGVRHHDLADDDRGRRAEHRCDQDVAERVGDDRAQYGRVDDHDRAGDAGHAPGHDDEQLAAAEPREIGAHEQRRLDHADEDIGGGGDADRAAHAHRAPEPPRKGAHHRRQDAPVEQQRRQDAHDQNDRQSLEREHELAAGKFRLERQRAAADIAEHEGGAGAGRRRDGLHHLVESGEGAAYRLHLEQQQRQRDGDAETDGDAPRRNGAAVLADKPRNRDHRRNADQRAQDHATRIAELRARTGKSSRGHRRTHLQHSAASHSDAENVSDGTTSAGRQHPARYRRGRVHELRQAPRALPHLDARRRGGAAQALDQPRALSGVRRPSRSANPPPPQPRQRHRAAQPARRRRWLAVQGARRGRRACGSATRAGGSASRATPSTPTSCSRRCARRACCPPSCGSRFPCPRPSA